VPYISQLIGRTVTDLDGKQIGTINEILATQVGQIHHPQIVAMSALLTTTLKGMKMTVDALREAGLDDQVKIMIGGAPVSREYADQIGVQGYADSAVGAVYEAERLLKG